jgi:hypothetical protein
VSLRRLFPVLVAGAALVAAAACNNSPSSSSSSSTTSPSGTQTTDTFSGTVSVRGNDVHTFTITISGDVQIDLTDVNGGSTIPLGVAVGTPNGAACSVLPGASVPTPASATAQLTGAMTSGTYCVQVYDIGSLTGAVTYTVTVTHT